MDVHHLTIHAMLFTFCLFLRQKVVAEAGAKLEMKVGQKFFI